ncbi:MAG: hypothetical protein JNM70_16125 [Anaerolineae bacterium]|nr:hypothetical protein [Anaerolineae bacterium]
MTETVPSQMTSCESSLAAQEALMATAPRTDVWILLEYDKPWGAQALEQSDLPEGIKAYINQQMAAIPNARFQFIRRGGNMGGIDLFVARSSVHLPRLYHFRLDSYDDLLSYDLAAIAADRSEYTLSDQKLFLVCTNGKRDVCCAKHGLPLVQAMSQIAPEAVWQTTHIGGHRFAATLVCLPEGVYYGRVPTERSAALIQAHQRGEMLLDYSRGWCVYDAPTQAADHFLRQETGEVGLGAFECLGVEGIEPNRWRAHFRRLGEDFIHTVTFHAELSGSTVFQNTGDAEPMRVKVYSLDEYTAARVDE